MNLKSPYRGLAAFEDSELDALYFFGRERDTEIVVANLIASRFTVLYGPSGVGKSSLLLAAVARKLRELPESPLVVVFSSWSDDPEPGLARVLAQVAGIETGELLDVAERAQAERDVYVILDQAEEYFTYHGENGTFEAALAGLVTRELRVNVLLSLREDTLARLDRLKGRIPNLFGNVLRLDRLDRAAGRAAILKPLERWGELEGEPVTAEDVLVDRVLDGVGTGRIELGPGGLGMTEQNGSVRGIEAPYLQLVMQRLWDVERTSGSATLRAETLQALGGARQIVADHLERAIEALTPAQREIAARSFDHLVTPSGTKIAHEVADLAQFAGVPGADVTEVVDTLARHRILRTDESGRWEIFHDVLAGAVLGWKSRYDAERAVERARQEARRRHRRLGFLAFGALVGLAFAVGLAAFAFSQRSDAREQARVAKGGQLVASALSLLDSDPELGLALALEAAEVDPTPRAEDALRQTLAASRERAQFDVGHPVRELDVDPTGTTALVVGDDGRVRALDIQTGRERWTHTVDGAAAAFAPDGRTVHVVDGASLLVLHAETGRPFRTPVPLAVPGTVERLVVSRDGTIAIVIAGKPRARAIYLNTGVRVGRVKHAKPVTDAAFGPADQLVASVGKDRVARLWKRSTWTEIHVLKGHVGQVLGVAFDRTGGRLATSSTDQTARIWRTDKGTSSSTLYGHIAYVSDVAFGPGGVLATASGDGTGRTWRQNGQPAWALRGHTGPVRRVAFAGETVVTGGADGTVRLWDPGTSIELRPGEDAGPAEPETQATTSGAEVLAIVNGNDVWVSSSSGAHVLRGHADRVNAVEFSPDGSRLLTAGRDHDVIVWDVETGKEVFRIPEAQSGSVPDASFSPDGRWIVTAGPISARLWSGSDGRRLMYLYGPTERLTAAAFEADSRTVVTREQDGTVRRYVCELCGGLDELAALARSRLQATERTLTDAERSRYLG